MATKQAIVDNVLGASVPCLYNDTLFKTLKFETYRESTRCATYDDTRKYDIAFFMPTNALVGALEHNATLGLILHLTSCPG